MNDDTQFSEAISLYIGFGHRPYPGRDKASLLDRFGPDLGNRLLSEIESIFSEIDTIDIDWKAFSVATDLRKPLRERHPVLNDISLDMIEWYFTYNWR